MKKPTTAVYFLLLALLWAMGYCTGKRLAPAERVPYEVEVLEVDTFWRVDTFRIQEAPEVVTITSPGLLQVDTFWRDQEGQPVPVVQRTYADTTETETGRVFYRASVTGLLDSIRLGYELDPIEVEVPEIVKTVLPRWQLNAAGSFATTGEAYAGLQLQLPRAGFGLEKGINNRGFLVSATLPLWRSRQKRGLKGFRVPMR